MEKEDLINGYFEQTLTAEDKKKFDFLIKTDVDFAFEVNFQKKTKKAITLNERENLKKKLRSFETKEPKTKNYKIWYTAASIALLFGFGFYFTQLSSSKSLYNDYYETYPNVVAPTVRGESLSDLKSEAFYEYDNGNYKKSATLFNSLYKAENEDYALLYGGISLLELDKTNEATTIFKQIDLTKNDKFTPYVKWYLALAYLKEKQNDKAISLLNSLANSENPQRELAKKLLLDLD